MIFSIGLVLFAVFLTGISQVLLKLGSQNKIAITGWLAPYLNIQTISAYVILLLVTIISTIALIEVPLKLFSAIASLSFVFVVLLSRLILNEEINQGMFVGILIIVSGVMVFNI